MRERVKHIPLYNSVHFYHPVDAGLRDVGSQASSFVEAICNLYTDKAYDEFHFIVISVLSIAVLHCLPHLPN